MPVIPSTYLIETTGDYDVPGLEPGSEYVLTLATADPSTCAATVLFPIGPGGVLSSVDDNSFLGTNPVSRRFVSPASSMQISVTSASDFIQVNLREVIRQVK